MVNYRIPKRVAVDDIIGALGEARTQEFLLAIYGAKLMPPPTIKATEAQLRAGIKSAERNWTRGEAIDRHEFIEAVPAIRKFFAENPRQNNLFIKFCNNQLADMQAGESAPEGERVVIVEKQRRNGHKAIKAGE